MVEESSKVISMLNTGFIICLVLTIVFFLISVLLFFVFDIKNVFLVRTGRAARKEIQKLQNDNFNTGRLMKYQNNHVYGESGSFDTSENIGKTETMDMSRVNGGNQQDYYAQQYNQTAMSYNSATQQPYANQNTEATAVLNSYETEVLSDSNNYDSQTTVLNEGTTTVLNTGMMQTQGGLNRKFDILKNQMIIHTEEVI